MHSLSIVINARLKSTRVPNKLLRPFSNSTLFEIALEKISKIEFVDFIFVGIADDELISIAENYPKIKILKRDLESVRKGTHKQTLTFKHYFQIPTDFIMTVNPCQPLLSLESIKKGVDFFHNTEYNSYTSCIKIADWIFDEKGEPLTNRNKNNLTTNNLDYYKGSHSFHIINKKFFQKNQYMWNFKSNDPALIEIENPIETLDVDTENEFEFTEFMYNKLIK